MRARARLCRVIHPTSYKSHAPRTCYDAHADARRARGAMGACLARLLPCACCVGGGHATFACPMCGVPREVGRRAAANHRLRQADGATDVERIIEPEQYASEHMASQEERDRHSDLRIDGYIERKLNRGLRLAAHRIAHGGGVGWLPAGGAVPPGGVLDVLPAPRGIDRSGWHDHRAGVSQHYAPEYLLQSSLAPHSRVGHATRVFKPTARGAAGGGAGAASGASGTPPPRSRPTSLVSSTASQSITPTAAARQLSLATAGIGDALALALATSSARTTL